MNTTHTRRIRITAAIVGAAAPALLFLGTGTAQAVQDVSEHGGIVILDHLPTPRNCPSCGGFNPQPDPPGNPDPSSQVGVGNPNHRPSQIIDPGSKIGVGNPN
jgi:hypothetical protein